MTLEESVNTIAFLVAAFLPFFIVLRWQGGGFVLAVLFGWGLVHVTNLFVPRHDPVDAVFVGVWFALGWAFMSAWCFVCAIVMACIRFVTAKRLKRRFN